MTQIPTDNDTINTAIEMLCRAAHVQLDDVSEILITGLGGHRKVTLVPTPGFKVDVDHMPPSISRMATPR